MKKHFPLLLVFVIFYTVVVDTSFLSLKKTDGKIVYPLDDAYIHMAIAKNFAKYNVWGVTKYEFSSSSSSPLWTFILSCAYKIFGVKDVIPFALNLIVATLFIYLSWKIISGYFTNYPLVFVISLFYIFAIPLPTITFLGMEHTLHAFLCVFLMYFLTEKIINNPSGKNIIWYLFLVALSSVVRYENMFFIFSIFLVLLFLKKYKLSLLTLLAGAFPIVFVGIVQKLYGWWFFPNSVILKGNRFELSCLAFQKIFTSLWYNIFHLQWLFFLLVFSFIFLFKNIFQRKDFFCKENIWIYVFVLTSLFHCASKPAGFFWFYRYEAYLAAIGMLAVVVNLTILEHIFKKQLDVFQKFAFLFIALASVVVSILFFLERITSYSVIPQTSQNIYHQQYQMGLFLKKFYTGEKVALNDIGACCYIADIKLLDLWGLGSKESAKNKLLTYSYHSISSCDNKLLLNFNYNWTKKEKCKIAIIYDAWFPHQTSKWTKVGSWRIQNNMVCAYDKVEFYAIDKSHTKELILNLKNFSKYLPKDVIQSGLYTYY